jgi:tRNA dimethylallyltransferase
VQTPRPSRLVVVAGPTGAGKSHLALRLAREFGGEIVNCDSLQVYQGMDIGTAKTPEAERLGVPHHLFDFLDPAEVFNAGDYAALARPVVREIAGRGRIPVVAGGTGFYLRALLDGLAEGPRRDDGLRRRLKVREDRRAGSLHRLLRRMDPAVAARIHANDRNKLIRALEICLLARRPASEVYQQGSRPLEGFRVLQIGLNPTRAMLHQRIAARTRLMFEGGLVREVQALVASGHSEHTKALESIGYKESLALLAGRVSLAEAIELTTIATRQYAKRQVTWFRRQPSIFWINDFGDSAEALEAAREYLAAAL